MVLTLCRLVRRDDFALRCSLRHARSGFVFALKLFRQGLQVNPVMQLASLVLVVQNDSLA